MLMSTSDCYIFYTYTKDHFFATGKIKSEINDWLEKLKEANVYIKVPLRFPLQIEDLACTPTICNGGHNVLGNIYMALREAVSLFYLMC